MTGWFEDHDRPAIELIDVHQALGGEWVLRGVSFAVPADRITVLLGPSGVGKTTCIRLITGLLMPDAGDVLVEGQSRLQLRKAEHLALARRFGVLIQGSGLYNSALWGSMTVLENLMFQLRAVRPELSEAELRKVARERLEEVGLAAQADMLPATLSGGMTKRVALARALVTDPDFLVLDSFEDGVDPVRLGRLCDLIRWHHEKLAGTYIVTTHDMEVARRLADHVVVLWEGRVVQQGPADAVLTSDIAEVRQFVTGDVQGPLALRGDPSADRPPPHTETGFWVPIPVAVGITLTIVTASAAVLGGGSVLEVAAVVLTWVACAVLLGVRHTKK